MTESRPVQTPEGPRVSSKGPSIGASIDGRPGRLPAPADTAKAMADWQPTAKSLDFGGQALRGLVWLEHSVLVSVEL